MADEDYRWTLRGVPRACAERASAAATRRKVSLGAYVCEALDRQHQAEHQPFALELAAPPSAALADVSAVLSAALAQAVLVERVVAAAVSLAAAPAVPVRLRARANRVLREALPSTRALRDGRCGEK